MGSRISEDVECKCPDCGKEFIEYEYYSRVYKFPHSLRCKECKENKKDEFVFDYGIVEIGHRLNINKAINHEKILIKGGIRMGMVKKVRNFAGDTFWEIQIIHKQDGKVENKLELFKGSLDEYTVEIKHKGSMQIAL